MSRNLEHLEQVALIAWCRGSAGTYPELTRAIFAIPNGGHRGIKAARSMKAEGQRAGVSDLFLPVARGRYHGLFLELKAPGTELRFTSGAVEKKAAGRLSKEQKEWLEIVRQEGYAGVAAWGCEAGIRCLQDYMKGADLPNAYPAINIRRCRNDRRR